jgi:hypothetical protein
MDSPYFFCERTKEENTKIKVSIAIRITVSRLTKSGNLYIKPVAKATINTITRLVKKKFFRKVFQSYWAKDTSGDEKKRTKAWSTPLILTSVPKSTIVNIRRYRPIWAFGKWRASMIVADICNNAMEEMIMNTLETLRFSINNNIPCFK